MRMKASGALKDAVHSVHIKYIKNALFFQCILKMH